jgi:glucosylceramidase
MTHSTCFEFFLKFKSSISICIIILGISLLRQPIGSTDFAWEVWSLDDSTQDDFNLNNFALWRENDYIRPMLNLALNESSGRVKIFSSPWSK